MSSFDRNKRDSKIYNLHKSGKSPEEISRIYGLKLSAIEKIIKREEKKNILTTLSSYIEFISEVRKYAESHYNKSNGTLIYHSLWRYVNQRSQRITIDQLIEDINSKRIRGIGNKSIMIINEFIESTK